MRKELAVALVWLGAISSPAWAQSSDVKPFIVTNLSETREINKNLFRADLVFSAFGPDLSRLNQEIDSKVEALKKSIESGTNVVDMGRRATVSNSSGSHSKAKMLWHVRREIILQGVENEHTFGFMKNPPNGLIVNSLKHGISNEDQKKAEGEVSVAAIRSLMRRADLLKDAFGAKAYTLAEMTITTHADNSDSDGDNYQRPSGNGAPANGQDLTRAAKETLAKTDADRSFELVTAPSTVRVTAEISAKIVLEK
jgi:predicted secreted protein